MKGLKELIEKIRANTAMTADEVEAELNKMLPESWIPKSKYNEASEELKQVKNSLSEQEKLVKTMTEKAELSDELKKQVEDAQKSLKDAQDKYKADMLAMRKSDAISKALAQAKARNAEFVSKLIDANKITLSEDGSSAVGLKEQIEAIKKSDAYLFEAEDPSRNGGRGNGGNNPTVFIGGSAGSAGGAGGGTNAQLEQLFSIAGVPTPANNK